MLQSKRFYGFVLFLKNNRVLHISKSYFIIKLYDLMNFRVEKLELTLIKKGTEIIFHVQDDPNIK